MYIKPTQALWGSVSTKIDSMFDDRIKYALNWYNYGLTKSEFDRRCIASIIPPEEDAMIHKLGARWFNTAENIGVNISNGSGNESYEVPAKTGGRQGFVSPIWHGYGTNGRPHVNDPTIHEVARRRDIAYKKIVEERDAFKKQVHEVWDKAPSVNSLVKIWPPIVDLLPKEVVVQLETKVKRRTAKQLADDVDTKGLSVHILKAKVGQ